MTLGTMQGSSPSIPGASATTVLGSSTLGQFVQHALHHEDFNAVFFSFSKEEFYFKRSGPLASVAHALALSRSSS